MSIVYQSGSVYATSTGLLVTGRCRVSHIIFNPQSSGDSFTIRDGLTASAPLKLKTSGSGANATLHLDLSGDPMLFNDGIHLSALSSSCEITIILTRDRSS